jgi:hypothetical protein
MKIIFSLLIGFSLVASSVASAQQSAAPTQNAAQQPPGFDAFFAELGKLMENYPEAAKRFGIYDSASTQKALCGPDQIRCCKEFCPGWPRWCSSCVSQGCCDRPK